jgi:asparagine synthase (glutamine-hydrolysing)
MAFVARMSWTQPVRLDPEVVDCVAQHSAIRHEAQVLEADGRAAGACLAPSRAAHFPDGTLILLSGRPSVPRLRPDQGELEAIHALYRARGPALAERIHGSFALVVLDMAERCCVFARDRLGFVPLFYRIDREGVWVGDSIKPILASRCACFTLDHEAIYRYIHLKAFESPDTVVNEIKTARPGTLFTVTAGESREQRYWDIPVVPVGYAAEQDGSQGLEERLCGAIERGIGPGDRPTGIMVSGGLDSGVLSALAAHGRPGGNLGINVSFESRWSEIDESVYAQAVADHCGIPLEKVEFNLPRLDESLPTLWWNNHLPTANSGFKLNLIGMQAEALGNPDTLMLGEGADTVLLYGWNWKYFDRIHRITRLIATLPSGVGRDASGAMERLLLRVQKSRLSNDFTGVLRGYLAASLGYLKWKGSTIRPEVIDGLFHPGLRERVGFHLLSQVFGDYYRNAGVGGFSEQLVYASLKSYIPNQQLMNYHTSANYFGAELACPFADEQVVEYCLGLPWYEREGKRVLKAVAERWLPREVVHREKCAFLVPMTEWIRTHFRPLIEVVFSRETIEQRGLFDPQAMQALKQAFADGEAVAWPDIWTFVVLEAWLRINLDARSPARPESVEAVFPELANAAARPQSRRRTA